MIEIQNLNKTYDKKSRHENHVIRDISLTLPDKGFVCIIGESGCGKTSLLNAVGGLDDFDSGTITTADVSVNKSGSRAYEQERNNNFGYIFQNYYLLSDHSAAYNVYLGLHSLALSHVEKCKRVTEALKAVNMFRYAKRIVGELSGGQQQRVAIARAIARHPAVIFADEPTGNLDEENTANICTILRKISKTSLVIMVTHEENIARFFADRIITLGEGKVLEDSDSWKRESLSVEGGNTLYTKEYEEEMLDGSQVSLRILTEKDAAPVQMTVAVLKDKIVLKLDDSRTVSCTKAEEAPVFVESARPKLTLEAVDNEPVAEESMIFPEQNPPAKAGKGITTSMMFQESAGLLFKKGGKRKGIWFFLLLLTVLTVWFVGDYLTVANVDPKDFVVTDSHILELSVERGEEMDAFTLIQDMPSEVISYMQQWDTDFDVIPLVGTTASISLPSFPQLSDVSAKLLGFSFLPVERFEESSLIYGRMPEDAEEIVVDRWVLDAFLSEDGILQNNITDITKLLGKKLSFLKRTYAPTIVGICDCGEPHVYFPKAGLISLGVLGKEVLPLSELQKMYPGEYDNLVINDMECVVVTNNAGIAYSNKVGSIFKLQNGLQLRIVDAITADTYASIVVADSFLDTLLETMTQATTNLCFYAPDKQALKQLIEDDLQVHFDGQLVLTPRDVYGDSWASYKQEASLRADARIIITMTLMILSFIMLYLLQRAFVQQRIGMMSVYRLLGIPGRKLLGIFAMESLMAAGITVLPATALVWGTIAVLNRLTALNFSMVLPWYAALLVGAGITVYYLFVSLLPVCRLLKLPPARLAAKYDI